MRQAPARGSIALVLAVTALFLLALSALGPIGCSKSSSGRLIVHVVEINLNQPLQSDVVKQSGGGLTVMEDSVPIEIRSSRHDDVLDYTSSGPYGYVVLDRYRIEFEGTEEVPPVAGGLGWTVHVGETISGNLVVVPGILKTTPPLSTLVAGGEILTTAHITLTGHEATSNAPVAVTCDLQVNFANWAD